MSDELRPDDIPNLWREEPREPVRMSIDAVRRRAHRFETRIRRAYRIMGILMVCSAVGYAFLLYLFPGIPQRIGCTLTLAAYLYCAYQFRKRGPIRGVLADVPAATCSAYKAELERLRDFPFISNLMMPFIPGPAVFLMGSLIPEIGVWKAVGLTTALIASPSLLVIPLVRRRRHVLESEIRSLDALMR
jgi:hypothetical protein